VPYGVAQADTDKLTADMVHEIQEHDVAVVSLYPGLVRTEKIMEAAQWLRSERFGVARVCGPRCGSARE
jgi:dehydrogenase/reductase SDR family member 1